MLFIPLASISPIAAAHTFFTTHKWKYLEMALIITLALLHVALIVIVLIRRHMNKMDDEKRLMEVKENKDIVVAE